MNVIDNNDHYQQNIMNNFDQEHLSNVFDNCNNDIGNNQNMNMNNINNSMNNNMNNVMNNMNNMNNNTNPLDMTNCGRTSVGSSPGMNKLLLKHMRGRNQRDFKDLVANFWMQPQNNNSFQPSQKLSGQPRKNNSHTSLSGTDAFGNFHPVELSSNKNNNYNDGKPNAPMEMRIPLERRSNTDPLLSANNLGMNKNMFRSSSPGQRFRNNSSMPTMMDNNMIPPMTKSSSNFNTSRRVSMCNSSVISDDSNHSQSHPVKASASSIINAATSIVNGNDFDTVCFNNNGMNNKINMDPIPSSQNHMDGSFNNSNVVSEPGPYDIVCGRNSGAYNYIGNRRFRVTIEMNLQRYIDSPTREDKTNVIKSIVWMLHEQVGARFLKKETSKKSSGSRRRGTPRYTIMTDKQAREKVGHALRDLVITARKEQQGKKQAPEQASKDATKQQC